MSFFHLPPTNGTLGGSGEDSDDQGHTLSSPGGENVEEKKTVDTLQQNGFPSSFVHKYPCPNRRKEGMTKDMGQP